MTATEKKEKQGYKVSDCLKICANCRYIQDNLLTGDTRCFLGMFIVQPVGYCKEWEAHPKDQLTEPSS